MLALRNAFNQKHQFAGTVEDCVSAGSGGSITDFQSRKQRDLSVIGAILTDCYTAARVIPTPEVEEAINKLMKGTFDLRKHSMAFPIPQHVKDAYQVLSQVQSLSFIRNRKEEDIVDSSDSTSYSTNLELTWRLIQNGGPCLDSLSSTSLGLILPTLLHPLESIDAFIENCIGTFSSSFTERFQAYLVSLSTRLISGMNVVVFYLVYVLCCFVLI